MKPTPRRMPHLTAGLQVGGMSLFILAGYLPSPVGRPVAWIGVVLFGLGLVVALIGLVWSVWTLTSPGLRRTRGIDELCRCVRGRRGVDERRLGRAARRVDELRRGGRAGVDERAGDLLTERGVQRGRVARAHQRLVGVGQIGGGDRGLGILGERLLSGRIGREVRDVLEQGLHGSPERWR